MLDCAAVAEYVAAALEAFLTSPTAQLAPGAAPFGEACARPWACCTVVHRATPSYTRSAPYYTYPVLHGVELPAGKRFIRWGLCRAMGSLSPLCWCRALEQQSRKTLAHCGSLWLTVKLLTQSWTWRADLEGFMALERMRGAASNAQHIAHKAVFDATAEALLAELAPVQPPLDPFPTSFPAW